LSHVTEDIVVFLPGISGSVLEKDGKEIWGTSAGAILRAVTTGAGNLGSLALEAEDDPTLDDLGDGVTPTRLVKDTVVIPGRWKVDGYTKLERTIREALGLERGKTAFDFPYDWRRDNRVAARRLKRSVERWLHEHRRDRPKAKAVLVAHSMGGLVSRYYLEVLGGWEDVRALVTIGTPYGGALNSLDSIVNGHRMGIGPFKADLSDLLRSFTSVYQLLPTYACVDPGDGELRMVGDVPGLPRLDPARVKSALAFHDEIAAAVRARVGGPSRTIVPVVGIEQPTLQSGRVEGGELRLLRSRAGKDEGGDGTVPRVSAVPFELLEEEREVYAAEKHGSLQNHDAVLAHLRGVISRSNIEIRRTRVGGGVALSLDLEDAFPADQPVSFTVTPSRDHPALLATLTTAEGSEVAKVPLRRRPDGTQWGAFDPLPYGIYRLRVEGMGGDAPMVSPVTDLFLVAEDMEPAT